VKLALNKQFFIIRYLTSDTFGNISETTLSECYTHTTHGLFLWTAGQRTDPSSQSKFVWRTSNTYTTVSGMHFYTNWASGQPDYDHGDDACMNLWDRFSYKWFSNPCYYNGCSVCELDISQ